MSESMKIEEYREYIPTHLESFVNNVQINDLTEASLKSSTGNELLEIWYYGDLFDVIGEDQPYIGNTNEAPEKIVAKDPISGEEFLIFDGAKHGYDNMFNEKYDLYRVRTRTLTKYNIPASKLILELGYNIDYDDEKDEFDFEDGDNVILFDESTMPWDEVKRNGFDYIALYFINNEGEKIQFFGRELA